MFSPAGFGQTIAVVDRSGKVVSTSRHLLNVFNEAKAAYRERKAEITATREAHTGPRGYKSGRAFTIDEGRSTTSSRHSHRSHRSRRSSHDGSYRATPGPSRKHSEGSPRTRTTTRGLDRRDSDDVPPPLPARPDDLETLVSPELPETPRSDPEPRKPLIRAQTTFEGPITPMSARPVTRRSYSTDNIDMNLAYGDPPPNLMTAYKPDDVELRGLVGRVKGILDEAHCVQHSVKTTMASLQKNPEAMAAVALTLAEISNLAKKMAPGALIKVRMLAPSVFALLSSPQFLIAAGLGVGVTVIALGGYKIIKKIQAGKEERPMEEAIALGSEVSRIETWRQGIADVESHSVATSADGELITPAAARLSQLNLAEAPARSRRSQAPRESPKTIEGPKSVKSSSSNGSRSSKSEGSKDKKKRRVKKDEKAKPSPLRNVFSF